MKRDVRGRDLVFGNFWCLGSRNPWCSLHVRWKFSIRHHVKASAACKSNFSGRWFEDSSLLDVVIGRFSSIMMLFFLHPRRWRCCSPKALKLSTTRIGYCRGRDGIGVAFVCTMRKAWKYGTVPKSKEVWGFNHFKFSMTWQKVSRRSAGRVGIRLITYM